MEWIAIKAILSLVFVLALMVVVLFLLKKFLSGKTSSPVSGVDMQVLGTLLLQPKKTIHLIKVVNKYFVVGVTDQSIQPISELNDSEAIQILSNLENQRQQSAKGFSDYFNEYLGFIGFKSGGRKRKTIFNPHDISSQQ
ncbi:MAG: flagellar biosynthetic protein FliO [Ignavibacteriales bacterium]|nr:flagellar biosynthetic protein FliO [Ignavibacteriales bacterium]